MGSTGACIELVMLTAPAELEPDYDPMTHAELSTSFEADTEAVPAGSFVDVDPRGNDPFGF